MAVIAAISALGGATIPSLMSRKQTFPNSELAIQMPSEEHKYIIGPTENTFITEIIFLDLLEHILLPILGN
jgi:hypothetical protein